MSDVESKGERRDGNGRVYREMDGREVEKLMNKFGLIPETTSMGQYNIVDRQADKIVGLGHVDTEGNSTKEIISLEDEIWRKYDEMK